MEVKNTNTFNINYFNKYIIYVTDKNNINIYANSISHLNGGSLQPVYPKLMV